MNSNPTFLAYNYTREEVAIKDTLKEGRNYRK